MLLPQEGEITRIKNAGGFVNMVGRVNGNLNLSRSLGDLKYKQVKHLPPEAQMITAEPDIEVFDINLAEDEFFILACDGIWDVLTNQEACDFVRQKVMEEHMTLEEVVQAVMKRCLAKDPRVSQGIGGDNMTFLVVWLKPETMPPVSRPVSVAEASSVSAAAIEEEELAGPEQSSPTAGQTTLDSSNTSSHSNSSSSNNGGSSHEDHQHSHSSSRNGSRIAAERPSDEDATL